MTVQLYNLIIKNYEIMFQEVRRKLERLGGIYLEFWLFVIMISKGGGEGGGGKKKWIAIFNVITMCTEVNCFRFKDELVKKSFLLVEIWNFFK